MPPRTLERVSLLVTSVLAVLLQVKARRSIHRLVRIETSGPLHLDERARRQGVGAHATLRGQGGLRKPERVGAHDQHAHDLECQAPHRKVIGVPMAKYRHFCNAAKTS
eukprot:2481952-Pleurochrysis_carterae.AAC.3